MVRKVRQLATSATQRVSDEPRPFTTFSPTRNVVLLGDPGAGKSHLFRETALNEGARFLTARAFLVTPAARLAHQSLFIDGLDERRAGRGDRDTIDALVTKLFEVEPAKVRISCRVADWLGETDLAALKPYFEANGAPAVLILERLSPEEQRAVLSAQGCSPSAVDAFVADAEQRGLGDFLENPQNLMMLYDAVQSGTWPATRRELFEVATGLMLKEADNDRSRSGTGIYSADELRPVGGAILAVRLISDIEAISLADQDGTPEIPTYRSIPFFEAGLLQAALARRMFIAGSETETVDYAHRTTAEYLAAQWLADHVRAGLPLTRLLALIGVAGVPAPELRGLHAWLGVHLSEYAEQLIDADPYGVLTYGDAASLSRTSCAHLLTALGRLSQTNPWFRSGHAQSPAIGALSRDDMEGEFRAILNAPDSGWGVRSLIVDALATGKPLSGMIPDLVHILLREESSFAERAQALQALLRHDEVGRAAVIDAFRGKLKVSINALRVRAQIIEHLYGRPFGPKDVIELVHASLDVDDMAGTGLLWRLAEQIPLYDLPAILDGIPAMAHEDDVERRNAWEVASFYARILKRAWDSSLPFDPARSLDWLRTRHSFKGIYSGNGQDDLRTSIARTPARLTAIVNTFLSTLVVDDTRWLKWNELREVTLFEVPAHEMFTLIVTHLANEPIGTPKETFLYEAAFPIVFSIRSQPYFELLYNLPATLPHLSTVRDASVVSRLSDKYFYWKLRRAHKKDEHDLEKQRRAFESNADAIQSGMHIGWLNWAAHIYFGLYSDVDKDASPRDRLNAVLGEANAAAAFKGFEAALQRPDVPSFKEMLKRIRSREILQWWHVLVAGLNERWRRKPDLDGVSEELVRSLLAFDLVNPVPYTVEGVQHWLVHPWRSYLLAYRSGVVREVMMAVIRTRLENKDQHAEGLRELLTDPAFELSRKDNVIELVRDFPNADPFRLGDLIGAALKLPEAHEEFLRLAKSVLSGSIAVDERQFDMWLAAAYLLSPAQYQADVERAAALRKGLVFDFRDRSGFARHGKAGESTLSLAQLEFMARLAGTLYPRASHPTQGWSGDTNPWDATEYFLSLTAMISAHASQAATDALARLEADPALVSYRPHLLHDISNQQQLRRDSEYDRPDWPLTIKALSNGAPATVADFLALLVSHLDDLRQRIERDNTDIYKSFWNLDQWSRPEKPRPEEACRDFLVTLLRPRLAPLGITVEPEGHMAGDRRADISTAMPGKKILSELKRDYHADVWTAAEGQLDRFYAHDPEAKGFGVYVVFWFGAKRPSNIPSPPSGKLRPTSAAGMQSLLYDLLPKEARNRIALIVIDVSGPPDT